MPDGCQAFFLLKINYFHSKAQGLLVFPARSVGTLPVSQEIQSFDASGLEKRKVKRFKKMQISFEIGRGFYFKERRLKDRLIEDALAPLPQSGDFTAEGVNIFPDRLFAAGGNRSADHANRLRHAFEDSQGDFLQFFKGLRALYFFDVSSR